MTLPPYGQQYLDEMPRTGAQVAVGPDAWEFAKSQPHIVMVLPISAAPSSFKWPSGTGAIIHECGQYDDDILDEMATALLLAGNPFVAARRQALLDSDPMVWFYPEIDIVVPDDQVEMYAVA